MVIITGINGGIGNYLFNLFADKEVTLGVYHNTKPSGEKYNQCVQLNITDEKAVKAFAENLKETKNITLINCAGVSYNSVAHKANIDEWKNVVDVNLTGTFNMIRAVLPAMREQNFGRVINLSSVVSEMGVVGTSAYAASKAALNGMIKSMAIENAAKGITINNINLGYFNIGMINTVPADIQETIKNQIPMKQFGDPQNIFNTIEYIRTTPYLTGTTIDLNGGLY